MADWKPQVRRVSGGDPKQSVFIDSLIRERRFEEAERELMAALAEDEGSYTANLAMGRLYQAQRRFDQSLPYLERAMASDPMQPEAALLAGVSHFVTNEVDRAAECFRTGIDLDNRLAGAHFGMALTLARQKDLEGAIKHLNEVLRLDPPNLVSRLLLTRLLRRTGDPDGARATLEEMVEMRPDQRAAVMSLAVVFSEQQLYDEALNLLDTFIERNPEDSIALTLFGYVKMRTGDYAGAETAFRRSMEPRKRPGPFAKLSLVDTLIPQGKFDEARDLLGSIRLPGPQRVVVNKRYGDLYFGEGDYGKACAAYRSILLHAKDGADDVERIEQAVSAAGGDEGALAEAFRTAVNESREAAFQKLAESDWQEMFQRFQPALMQLWEVRRQQRKAS